MSTWDQHRRTSSVETTPAAPAITECPFCHSNRIATGSKPVTEATYWRCLACGEIWNPARCVSKPRPRGGAW